MEANVYEKPQTLAHKTEHGLTIVSDQGGIMVVGILCARALWPDVSLTCQSLTNLHVLEVADAWVVLNDDDAAQVQYHIDTYAPKSS